MIMFRISIVIIQDRSGCFRTQLVQDYSFRTPGSVDTIPKVSCARDKKRFPKENQQASNHRQAMLQLMIVSASAVDNYGVTHTQHTLFSLISWGMLLFTGWLPFLCLNFLFAFLTFTWYIIWLQLILKQFAL